MEHDFLPSAARSDAETPRPSSDAKASHAKRFASTWSTSARASGCARVRLGRRDGVAHRVRDVVRGAPQQRRGVLRDELRAHDLGPPPRERPRLVEDDAGHAARDLEGAAALDQDPEPRADARPDHDRRRRRQPERAGARHDQHRHAEQEPEQRRPLALVPAPRDRARRRERRPHDHGDARDDHDAEHEVARDDVREGLDARLGPLGRLDEAHDAAEHGVVACVEIKLSRRVVATAESLPRRHRRDACSMAWRCRFPPLDGASTAAYQRARHAG